MSVRDPTLDYSIQRMVRTRQGSRPRRGEDDDFEALASGTPIFSVLEDEVSNCKMSTH